MFRRPGIINILVLGVLIAGAGMTILKIYNLKLEIDLLSENPPASQHPTRIVLESELLALQKQFEELEKDSGLQKKKGDVLEEVKSRLEEIRHQSDLLGMQKGREERLLDLAAQAASQSVGTATGVISFLAILFTVVVLGLSLVSGLHFREFGAQLERDKLAAEAAIKEVRSQKDDAIKDLKELRRDLGDLEDDGARQIAAIGEREREWKEQSGKELQQIQKISQELDKKNELVSTFLDRLVSVHAAAFSEILGTLPLGVVFSEEEGQRVRLKGQELKGRLLLWHPDEEKKKGAVMLLGAVGTKVVIADLRRLQSASMDKDLALLVESAIGRINSRA